MKFLSLLLLSFAPLMALAGTPSALILNREIAVIDRGLNYAPPAYNRDRVENKDGKVETVWSQDRGGYFLKVESNLSTVSGLSEIFRSGADGAYKARKVRMNPDSTVQSITECDSKKGAVMNDMLCVTVTDSMCQKVKTVYTNPEAMDKDLQACEKVNAKLEKMRVTYEQESKTPAFTSAFSEDTKQLRSDFGRMTNLFSITDTFKAEPRLSHTNGAAIATLKQVSELCNAKDIAENGVWRSPVSAKAPGNTSSQRGQR